MCGVKRVGFHVLPWHFDGGAGRPLRESACLKTLQGWDEGTRYAGAVKLLIWPLRLFVSGNRQRMDVNCNLSYIQKANCFYLAVRISWIVRNARTNVCVRHA